MSDARPVVAIADVHGRADLLGAMLEAVECDLPDARVVMLGDATDRGPDVPATMRMVMEVPDRFPGSTVLLGNHENWLLETAAGDAQSWDLWRTWGGTPTLRQYGIDPDLPPAAMAHALEETLADLLAFLRARPRFLVGEGVAEGMFFAHAGVDPLVPFAEQDERDLFWIREPFLSWPHELERLVVHGHTIVTEPVTLPHRIGLDTGAYHSGVLSALLLEPEGGRRLMQAREGAGVAFGTL